VTEEARIRVENFTLAAAPSNATPAGAEAPPSEAATPPAAPATGPKPGPSIPTPSKRAPAKAAASSSHASTKPQGSYAVQLGAFKSGSDAANKRWTRLDQEYPQLLSGLSPKVSPKKGASGTLYRLQVAGLTEKRAHAICKTLKAQHQACVLIHP
jgi:cell division protein FtsN